MASKKLMGRLNSAIAREIQVSIQYMWQHIMVRGINAEELGDIFKKFSIEEMKHAEEIAERVFYLGGVPTHQPLPIKIGKTAKEMLRIDKKQEEEAIALYKEIIILAEKEGDTVTANLFADALADEEEHHNHFSKLLAD
jgi:bacterioferritin